jgi:hypothetical protein
MRHLVGRLIAGPTTEGRAGVARPRPCPRVAWGVAVSVLAHAFVIALTLNATPPRKPVKEASRLSVRLVARPPQAVPTSKQATAPVVAYRRAAVQVVREAKAAQPARAAKAVPPPSTKAAKPLESPAAQVAAASTQPIDGSVFALPHIPIAGGAAPRWMKPQGPSAMPTPPFVPPPAMHAHAAREAGRMQIVLALQRQVSAWQAPDDAGDGMCSLHATPDDLLDCDSAALQQLVGAQVAGLSGLLKAYRGIDPSASRLSIAYQQGRYSVSLASAPPAQ